MQPGRKQSKRELKIQVPQTFREMIDFEARLLRKGATFASSNVSGTLQTLATSRKARFAEGNR